MSEKQARKLQQIYSNTGTAEALCQTIAYDLTADFVLITWHMKELLWYIPCIYCSEQIYDTGWYLEEKPALHNMPIKPPGDKKTHVYHVDDKLIFFSSDTFSIGTNYAFTLRAYLDMLYAADLTHRQFKRKEILLSNICHSIRTPLNGVLHMTNMLMAETSNSDITREHLQYLHQSALTMANNIFDIIDITQLDIGKLPINKTVCNVRDVISQVIRVARSMNKARDVTIDYHTDPLVPHYAYTDFKRVKQILINLFDNALKYTHSGEVTLYTTASLVFPDQESGDSSWDNTPGEQYQVIFTVSDTGIGLSEEQKNTLFKPVETVPQTSQYGIGLQVSYRLAQKLGGTLQLKTSDKDRGSCFELSLVVYEEEPPSYNRDTLKALAGKTALLIDDSNDRIAICQALDSLEMTYNIASDYEEILVLHLGKKYDLVICKTNMEHENGIDICTKLQREWKSVRGMRFIGVTDDAFTIPKGMFDIVIGLPIEQSALKEKIVDLFSAAVITPAAKDRLFILAVDDERINRVVTEKILRNRGYRNIDTAGSGEEALMLLKSRPSYYNVVISDIRMPHMNGFELAKRISQECMPRPHLIGLTAQMIMDDEPAARFDELIFKPINLDELDSCLQRVNLADRSA